MLQYKLCPLLTLASFAFTTYLTCDIFFYLPLCTRFLPFFFSHPSPSLPFSTSFAFSLLFMYLTSTPLFHSPLPHFSVTLYSFPSFYASPVSIQYCSYGATQLQQLVSESQLSSEEVHYMLSVLATSLTQLGEDKLGWLTDHGAWTLGRATDSVCMGM